MTRLYVFLGAGGVGKTTLAASCALALARANRKVGLLGIDPSRRLQGALGLELADADARVPDAGELRAAILQPHQTIRRWVAEENREPHELARIEANPFFAAVGDRLASATDVLAAARVAEWLERAPELDALVIDTAPGLSALGFLTRPRELAELLRGPLVSWLRLAASGGAHSGVLRFGARRILAGFSHLAGSNLVGELAGFFASVGAPLQRLVERLERAQVLLRDHAELLLVTSPRDSTGARELAGALRAAQLEPRAVVVNRTWPQEICAELAALDAGGAPLLTHAQAYARAQARVVQASGGLSREVICAPSLEALVDTGGRAPLLELGAALLSGLAQSIHSSSTSYSKSP